MDWLGSQSKIWRSWVLARVSRTKLDSCSDLENDWGEMQRVATESHTKPDGYLWSLVGIQC